MENIYTEMEGARELRLDSGNCIRPSTRKYYEKRIAEILAKGPLAQTHLRWDLIDATGLEQS